MNDDKPTLREIAQRASDRHGGVHGRALGRVAQKAGLTLSYTTVDRILAGTYNSVPSAKTLDALATLAGVNVEDVYRAAGKPIPMGRFADQLPPDADLLTGSQRDAVIAVVRQFAAANKALHEREEVMGNAEHPAATKVDDSEMDAEIVPIKQVHQPQAPKRSAARKTGRTPANQQKEADRVGKRIAEESADSGPSSDLNEDQA